MRATGHPESPMRRGPDAVFGRRDRAGCQRAFTMTPTPEGFLKLDSRTGVVSQCLRQGPNYECRLIPDERAALQDEIDRLTRENARTSKPHSRPFAAIDGTAPPKAGEGTPGAPQQALPSD